MTRRLSSPALLVFALVVGLSMAPAQAAPAKKAPKKPARPAAKAAAKKPSARAGRQQAASKREAAGRKSSRREERASARDRRRGRNDRQASTGRNSRNERASRNDRRSRRDERRAETRQPSRKELKRMSARERRAFAAAEARRRREAAERARQAAIARALYLARIRAQDQAYRDETQANIQRDETTGEDMEVRRVAVEALGNHAGTVVVMDPKTGRVYTVVNQNWALRRGFKPCSTVKLVTGLAGLNDNVIDPVQTVNISSGSVGLDLTESLARSNNLYFQRVGGTVGFDRMMLYARKFGLGQPTGINHPGEWPGRLPVVKEGYSVNRMSSHGDDIEVTPIQLANMASAIANGGELLVPHLPRTPQEDVKFKRVVRAKVDVPEEHLRRLVPGMIGAVNWGSGRTAYDPLQTIAGKTGTCIDQRDRSWLGLFTSFAPVHDPKLAVAVVTHGSSERGKTAAAIAGKIYRGLGARFGVRPDRPMLADDSLIPRPKTEAGRAVDVSDEEEAEAEEELNKAIEAQQQQQQTQGTDVYVVREAGAPQSNVKSTSRIYEKPAAAEKAAPASPEAQPGAGRPRRVNPEERDEQR